MSEIDSDDLLKHILGELSKLCGFQVEQESSLLKTGLLDSIGLMELILSVQQKYTVTVEISDLKMEEFDTPKLMTIYFRSHIN
ncbi:MAG: hypothetical protein JNM24_05635 [Bdellovibrionaceae bacterium]|nr:hypothetical protein [Pseudobdellovibrionaceae bacterium]